MRNIIAALAGIVSIMLIFMACSKEETEAPQPVTGVVPSSPVIFDLDSVPYATLSHYNFFVGDMTAMQPVQGVLPYEPITPLFSDYAHKYRFVWMPAGAKASYVADDELLHFPVGAVLIKSFYYDNAQPGNGRRFVETRVMIKKQEGWIFADYVWNADQTEAVLDLNGSYTPVTWVDDAGLTHEVQYRIPSEVECFTCHKYYDQPVPIALKPQNINSVITYADGPKGQLAKWEEVGYLQAGYPQNIETVVDWTDTLQDLTQRVRAYLDMNCAHCHSDGRHCDYRPMRFAWSETTDPANLGICVPPEDPIAPSQTYIIESGNKARSMLYYRISTDAEAERMPLLGRTVQHEEAIEMIGQWIDQLQPDCD